jgi:DNA/RNA-binding domain of Phe-tRNA-synthetase-like protein
VLKVAPDLSSIVRPVAVTAEGLTVSDQDPRLDTALAAAAERARANPPDPDVTAAVRAMYRRVGIDPTKTRPSSEALLRRVRKGDPLPRINTLVDIVNWCSLESQLPFGLYDRDRVRGPIVLRLGRAGEQYAGIRRDAIHLEGRLTLADDEGPFGNPTADSARTMVTPACTRVLVVIFAPVQVPEPAVERAARLTRERIEQYGRP